MPYVIDSDGSVRLLMVTSRQTRRWIIPKGNRVFGMAHHLAAAKEAFEEAGVLGVASHRSLGSFGYWKRLRDGRFKHAMVEVFPLAVNTEADEWPEAGERERRWFSLAEAIEALEEEELKELVGRFSPGFQTAG